MTGDEKSQTRHRAERMKASTLFWKHTDEERETISVYEHLADDDDEAAFTEMSSTDYGRQFHVEPPAGGSARVIPALDAYDQPRLRGALAELLTELAGATDADLQRSRALVDLVESGRAGVPVPELDALVEGLVRLIAAQHGEDAEDARVARSEVRQASDALAEAAPAPVDAALG